MVSFGSSEPVRPQRPIPNNLFQRRRFNRQASRVDESDSSDEEEYQGNEVVPRINQEHLSELSPPERTKFLAMVDAKKRMLLAKWAREGKDIPRHDRNELQVTVHHNLGHEFSSPENPDIHKKRSNRSFRNLFGLVSRDMPPVPDMPSRDPVDVSNRDDAASAPSLHQLTGAMSLNGSQDAFDSISGILNGSRRDAGSTLSIDADRPRDRTKTVNESQKLETIEKTHDNPPEISASSMHNLPYQSFSLLRDNTALLALSDQSGTHYFAPRNDDNESSHIKKAQSASAKKESDKRAEIGVSTSESSQDPFCKCNVTLLRKKRGHKSMVSTDNSTRHFDERYHTSPKDPPASNSYPTDDTDTSQAYQGEGLLEAETAFPPVMVLEPVSGCQHLGSGSQIDISRLRPTNEVNAYSDMANTDLTGDRTSSDSFEEILAPYSSTIGEIQRPRYLPLKQDVPKLENHATTKGI
ncbi:MAG: hypothetical protein LQ351_001380 [Letrouitia transgressa]|nr:MAG: hypothetical protein LQ351_001380 [Letrouitia transgressa]